MVMGEFRGNIRVARPVRLPPCDQWLELVSSVVPNGLAHATPDVRKAKPLGFRDASFFRRFNTGRAGCHSGLAATRGR